MPVSILHTVDETAALIKAGRTLLLAGNESLFAQLPPGNWIGGTSANFLTKDGGVENRTHILVTDITDLAKSAKIRGYDAKELHEIGKNYPANGFTVIIVPGLSVLHSTFAREVQSYEGIFNSPLFGWISGVALDELDTRTPKIFVGNNVAQTDRAAVMHVELPSGQAARLDIINMFSQGDGDEISFDSDGFDCLGACQVGGVPANFAAYITERAIDLRLPLVADYKGVMINVSLRSVDPVSGKVSFFAPVARGIKYRFAKPAPNYIEAFSKAMPTENAGRVILSCNCVHNYLYDNLEGKKTGTLTGPATFGEIAYILLNRTLSYLSLEKFDQE